MTNIKTATIPTLARNVSTRIYRSLKKYPTPISTPDQMNCPTKFTDRYLKNGIFTIPAVIKVTRAKPKPLLILEINKIEFLCL